MLILQVLVIIFISYIFGSIPTAYLLTLLVKRINIFETGSGNMGGTNVARTMGLHWGVVTSALDGVKGMAAVAVASLIAPDYWLLASIIAAVAAVAGHNWSIFATWLYSHYNKTFAIRGGKGAAVAFGTLIVLTPPEAWIMLLAIGISLAIITRYASLSVLVSFASAFIYIVGWSIVNADIPLLYIPYVILLTILILWRFRENIERLATGTERKLGERVA
jgi:acyl phosphate:glycerol-3-phosphate acyltransferase